MVDKSCVGGSGRGFPWLKSIYANKKDVKKVSRLGLLSLGKCNTDLFIALKITNGTITDRETLKNLFLLILLNATKEKPFDFHKATMRYYANNYLLLHTRVFGEGATSEKRFENQRSASDIAIKCLKNVLIQNSIECEIAKQIWVFYEEKLYDFQEILKGKYTDRINIGCDCDVFYNEHIMLVTDKKRELAETACMGLSFKLLEENYIKEKDFEINADVITNEIREFEKNGSRLRISAEKYVTNTLDISANTVAIISISYFFILILKETTNLLYKIGLAAVVISIFIFSINFIFSKKYMRID